MTMPVAVSFFGFCVFARAERFSGLLYAGVLVNSVSVGRKAPVTKSRFKIIMAITIKYHY